ncbi:MAG TPA: YqhA family protein [Ktedonobacterales bacterium]
MARLGRALTMTRVFVLFGVAASLCLSAALFLLVAARTVGALVEVLSLVLSSGVTEKALKTLAVASIEFADLTLLASALLIVGLGLFELFIGPAPMPDWLIITSLDDLKASLVNVVVVVLGIAFLGQVVTWDGVRNLLPFGVAIAAVIVALSVFGALSLTRHRPPAGKTAGNEAAADAGEDGSAGAGLDIRFRRTRSGERR